MAPEDIKQLLESALDDLHVEVSGEGCSFQLNLISDSLATMSPVKRQQLIYQHLNEGIASGDIHAVTMKFFTPQKWREQV